MPRSNRHSFRPNLTELESREVPAVVSAKLTGGVVTVQTDRFATSVLVQQTPRNILIQDVTSNRIWTFSPASVSRVDVFGGIGADTLMSRGPASGKVVRLFGMGGKDTLIGGNGREIMSGGAGHDTLKGNGGNDALSGDAGNDILNGGTGRDVLNGGAGNDWLNGGGAKDNLKGGAGEDTLISIDDVGGDILDGGADFDILWVDQGGTGTTGTDTVTQSTGGDTLNAITQFANAGADRTLDGDRIADPTLVAGDSYETFTNRPLFSSAGPQYTDVQQGQLNDCWLLAGLGSTALVDPQTIRERVVDFGDGTYGVHLGDNFYRVDNELPVADPGLSSLNYTSLGAQASMWVSVMEKAYAYFRQGANAYPSIEWGNSFDVFQQAFKATDARQVPIGNTATTLTDAQMTALVKSVVDGGFAPTLAVTSVTGVPLMTSHQYIILGYTTSGPAGLLATVTLYNPVGVDGMTTGDGNEYDGIVTITLDQLRNNIVGGFEYATV